jgi:hypothetical protein
MTYQSAAHLAPHLQKVIAMTTLSFSRSYAGKMNRWGFALLAAGILAVGSPANAQLPRGLPEIPGLTGMCRIWIEGVPANQQPAPTDCVTAVRNRPVNGTVIFGDSPKRGNEKSRKGKSKKDSDDSPDQ